MKKFNTTLVIAVVLLSVLITLGCNIYSQANRGSQDSSLLSSSPLTPDSATDAVDLTTGTSDDITSDVTITTKPEGKDNESYSSDTYEDTKTNIDTTTTTATPDTDTLPVTDTAPATDLTTETEKETKIPESSESSDTKQEESRPTDTTDIKPPKETGTGTDTTRDDMPKYARSVPIIIYHHVLPDAERQKYLPNNEYTTPLCLFSKHMEFLYSEGYTVVNIHDVVAFVRGEISLPEKSVCITFDDGYLSNAIYAAPVLRKYGFRASVFAVMGNLSKTKISESEFDFTKLQRLSLDDFAENSDVFNIMCHTYKLHINLTKIPLDDIKNDLSLANDFCKTPYFAYPGGRYNDEIKQIVKDAGFLAAFTTEARACKPGDDVYAIPRIGTYSYTTVNKLKAMLNKK